MELKVKYWKEKNGKITAYLKVTNNGDYPSYHIFGDHLPSSEQYKTGRNFYNLNNWRAELSQPPERRGEHEQYRRIH